MDIYRDGERTEDDDGFVYCETTGESEEMASEAPRGSWQFMEKFKAGRLFVYRWRRPRELSDG